MKRACPVLRKDGEPCTAPVLRSGPYCYAHRGVEIAGATVQLAELGSLAEEFDRTGGGRWTAAEFIEWALPELRKRIEP